MNEWCEIRLAAIRHTHDQRKFRHVQTNEEKDSSDFYNPYIPSNVEIIQIILNITAFWTLYTYSCMQKLFVNNQFHFQASCISPI